MSLTLVIGNKNYSTWSLRPWLLLRSFGVPFVERRVLLSTPQTSQILKPLSPTGCVPVLFDNDLRVWDSLAICEYVSEQFLADRGWPQDARARAEARALAAEMHSGFQALRQAWPMNIRLQRKLQPPAAVAANIARIDAMWSDCLSRYGGPWLFGEFGIVDAMYAPVALRFHSYQPDLSPGAARYLRTVLADASIQAWIDAALQEKEIIDEDEIDVLAARQQANAALSRDR
jgi:glutathione S-transferase